MPSPPAPVAFQEHRDSWAVSRRHRFPDCQVNRWKAEYAASWHPWIWYRWGLPRSTPHHRIAPWSISGSSGRHGYACQTWSGSRYNGTCPAWSAAWSRMFSSCAPAPWGREIRSGPAPGCDRRPPAHWPSWPQHGRAIDQHVIVLILNTQQSPL